MNVNEYIAKNGTASGFRPKRKPTPLTSAPGSVARIEEYRQRIENGQPLFFDGDKQDCDGFIGENLFNRTSELRSLDSYTGKGGK